MPTTPKLDRRSPGRASWMLLPLALASTSAWAVLIPEASTCEGKSTPSERGAVVLSISANNPYPGLHKWVDIVRVDGPSAGKTCTLVAADTSAAFATSYIAAEVPVGAYRVLGVSGFNGAVKEIIAKAPEEGAGTFRVVAGQRSDLGRLIVDTPIYIGPGQYALYGDIGRATQPPEHAAARFGADAALLSLPAQPVPWLASGNSGMLEAAALSHPVGYEPPVDLGAAGLAFRAGIGGVLLLGADGNVRRCPAPNLHAVLAVQPARAGGGVAVVGGEHGLFARLEADCTYRAIDRGNLPTGVLRALYGDDARGWVAVNVSGEQTGIYKSARLDGGDWQRVGGFEGNGLGQPNGRQTNWTTAWTWGTPEGFAYAVSAGQIHHFNLATGSWTEQATPPGKVIATLGGDGARLGMVTGTNGAKTSGATQSFVPGLAGKVFASADYGKTWTLMEKPKKVMQDPPMITKAGTVLQVYGSLAPWKPSLLFRSADNGATWAQVPIELEPATRLTQVADGRIFATSYLTVRVSEDDGATWKTLLPVKGEKDVGAQ